MTITPTTPSSGEPEKKRHVLNVNVSSDDIESHDLEILRKHFPADQWRITSVTLELIEKENDEDQSSKA